jgi:hypothetical protein
VPDPNFVLSVDPVTARATNVEAAFWQIGFGNHLLNAGIGGGTGMGGLPSPLFYGNDQGVWRVDLVEAAALPRRSDIPAGAVCLANNNWGNFGIDGCCDNSRDPSQPFANDDILNPYYDVYASRNGAPGIYSLAWQQDYPMAVLLKTPDGRHFAAAAVATTSRGNSGSGENGPCADPPGVNPAPCDFRAGYYNFKDVADGLPNPLVPGARNIVPWQATPEPYLVSGEPADPADPNGSWRLDLAWQAARIHTDGSVRPSTNPTLAPQDPARAPGVGVADLAAAGGLVRYVVETASTADPAFASPLRRIETAGTGLSLVMAPDECVRLRTRFGKKREAAVWTTQECRKGRCGDTGYEVVSGRRCFRLDADADGLPESGDNCPLAYNPGQEDGDLDGFGDACDTCPAEPDPSQVDIDRDGLGDACDPCTDADEDGLCSGDDNCPDEYNPGQEDVDGDGEGDPCDLCEDVDTDLVCRQADTCPSVYNPHQWDHDYDRVGDACDNCPSRYNPGQEDAGGDGIGDVCDACADVDLDGRCLVSSSITSHHDAEIF